MAKKPPIRKPSEFKFDPNHPNAFAIFTTALGAILQSQTCQGLIAEGKHGPQAAIEFAVTMAAMTVDEVNRRMGADV